MLGSMNIIQNEIKRTLAEPESIEYVRGLLESNRVAHRSELAVVVCERFGFHDARGWAQVPGCLKALRELEGHGHFTLPAARTSPPRSRSPQRLSTPVAPPVGVPAEIGGLQGLRLVLVDTPEQMRLWNELMLDEHPQGAGPLVGRQLRYLIGSDHGWLGGFGFASPALQLAERDAWIGWDSQGRRKYLHYVVGMSRFLLRPAVTCRNLASKVLSMSLSALPNDFECQYGYRPWLVESFIDTEHSGACYRAANWIEVGQTSGRGRQDRFNEQALSPKAIFVYPLENHFRARMELSPNAGRGALTPTDGLEDDVWAEQEFGGAPLGDARLSRRLVNVAAAKAQVPDRAFSGVAKGDWPMVKAYYRMIDQPQESAVSLTNILATHRGRTVRRMMGQKVVLCVQDGSDLHYNNLDQCEGLGVIGTNQTGAKSRGLHLHSTLAIAPNGLPLGVLRADCEAPREKSPEEKRPSHAIPIEEKKNFVWIEHHRDLVELGDQMPHTRLIDVCDREADFFELFDEQRQHPRVELLVRAKHNRTIGEQPFKLFAAVRQAPVESRILVSVPRQSARAKKSKQKARSKRPSRMAELAIRAMPIQLRPAHYHADKAPIDIWVVHALEENPPTGAQPVEWFLLTTLPITSAVDAEQCLRWYCLRWRIEDWHRTLKSGCRIEDLAHKSAERLRRAIAINLVIAWRIMLMTLLGREMPDLPADVLFSDIELRTMQAYAKKNNLKAPTQLGEAVRLVARIGGYLGRNNDPPPGHQLLWQGYTVFQFMCLGFALPAEE